MAETPTNVPVEDIPTQSNGGVDPSNQSVVSNLTDDGGPSVVGRVGSTLTNAWAILLGGPSADSGDVLLFGDDDASGGEKDVILFDKKNVIEEEVEVPAIDFLQDERKDMTWGRRIALANEKSRLYNPHYTAPPPRKDDDEEPETVVVVKETRPLKVTKKEVPSIAKAWAYFDHFALPRFMLNDDGTFNRHDLKRAEPGESEHPTKLYSPLFTPLSQMGDWGLGVGLYFSTLRSITMLTFVAGLMNIPNFIYFSGPDYSDNQEGLRDLLKGSAICTLQEWVPCEGCVKDDFLSGRFGIGTRPNATNPSEDIELAFARHNDCDGATFQQGMINFGTMLLVLVGILVINFFQKRAEIAFDEDEQTAQDYSIRIQNPPDDAVDPTEWRTYFKKAFGAHATVVTVALDNDPLIRALRERRECIRKIELNLDPGTSLDTLTLAKIAAEVEGSRGLFGRLLAMVAKGIPEFFGRMAELEAKIKGWAQLDYSCSNVFITFETEEEQRRVLSALGLGSYHVKRQNKSKIDAKYLFRGNLILKLNEPDEPNTIRWADLNVKFWDKLKPLATTTVFSLISIFLIALLINVINDASAAWSAIAIAVFNSLFPIIAKVLTDMERHSSEGLKQTSLYFKIAVFRWVNTAVVITIITPFTKTLEDSQGLIPSIYAIFFAEIVTTNAVQILDPAGHFKRHYLAPRAKSQDAMNLAMQGAEVELAERYTNMTKLLFLALWYCSIFPGALFMCSFALCINYFTDGFSLMRTWKRLPNLGTRISKFSRRYFFSTAIVAMAVVSAYYWSGFPYDNLCKNDAISSDYIDYDWSVVTGDGETVAVPITSNSESFRYCLQDYFRYGNYTFPALSRWQPEGNEWMDEEQETVVNIYGWTSLAVLCCVVAFFLRIIFNSIRGMFAVGHDHRGADQGIPFSDVPSISAFVPQVDSVMYSYPLLACDVEGVDTDLFDWTDPDRPHSYYDLTQDADELVGDLSVRDGLVFSILSHEAPKKKKKN